MRSSMQSTVQCRTARRAIAVVLVVALATGCSSTRALHGAPADNLRELPETESVRLLLVSGERIDVSHVSIVGDSLHARATIDRRGRSYGERPEVRPVTYALADIRGVESVRIDPVKTSLFVVVSVAVFAAIVAGADAMSPGFLMR